MNTNKPWNNGDVTFTGKGLQNLTNALNSLPFRRKGSLKSTMTRASRVFNVIS